VVLCKVLEGKRLHGVYAITLSELKAVVRNSAARKGPVVTITAASTAQVEGEFREQKRRKRVNSSEGERPGSTPSRSRNRLGLW
jgi:adenosine/AMP kinase